MCLSCSLSVFPSTHSLARRSHLRVSVGITACRVLIPFASVPCTSFPVRAPVSISQSCTLPPTRRVLLQGFPIGPVHPDLICPSPAGHPGLDQPAPAPAPLLHTTASTLAPARLCPSQCLRPPHVVHPPPPSLSLSSRRGPASAPLYSLRSSARMWPPPAALTRAHHHGHAVSLHLALPPIAQYLHTPCTRPVPTTLFPCPPPSSMSPSPHSSEFRVAHLVLFVPMLSRPQIHS